MMQSLQRYLVGLTLCSLPLLGIGGTTSAETLVMPRELVDFAHANGCAPIDDFFERPGMVKPPYVYGWLAGDKQNSAVFWCKKKDNGAKSYNLMFISRTSPDLPSLADSKQMGGCPAIIEWHNPPRGLSIEIRPRLPLSAFRYIAMPNRTAPRLVVANAKVLVNDYDGVENVFYCHKGQWLVESRH
jgi:hypothetical protein